MKCSVPGLVVMLLATAGPALAQPAAAALTAPQQRGRQVLAQACGLCHLSLGIDAPTYGPALHQGTAGGNERLIKRYILEGTARMPAFKYYLAADDVDAVVAYLKTVPAPAAAHQEGR